MTDFSTYKLNEVLNKSLKNINFKTPTPIQEKSIPLILQGNDILGSAQTGTGKTAAFCIPILELLMKSSRGSLLIMIPTRELAKQVLDVIDSLLGFKSSINTATLIGGESMSKQLSQLKKRPRIYVGTPGRINDHLQRGTLNLHDAKYLVLDETDRMLDMGFEVQINKIIKFLPVNKQVLMFSATIPDNILKMASKYLNNPIRISVGDSNSVAKNIKQEIIELKSDEKLDELVNQLSTRTGSVLIFVKTKYGTEKLSKALAKNKIKSFPLHGGLRQSKRNTIMKNFRDMKFRILIATDVAARGIDVPHIEHVINYDLPQMAEDFIHRIGRTARAGSKGIALSFVTKGDFSKWKEIQKILNPGKDKKNQSTSKSRNSKNSFSDKREGNKRSTFKKRPDYKKSFSKNDEGSDKKTFSKKRFSKNNDQGKYRRSSDNETRPRKSFSKNDEGSDKKTFSKKRFSKNNDQGKYRRSSDNETRPRKSFSKNDEGSDKKTFSKKRFSKNNDQGKYRRSSDNETRPRKSFSKNDEGSDKKTFSKKRFTNTKSKNSFNSNTDKGSSPRNKSSFNKKTSFSKKSTNHY